MSRCRYWKLSPDEFEKSVYDPEKVLTWDIKCVKEPEDLAQFIGIFLYKNGTPYDYETVHGITFYYNNIENNEVSEVTKFLKKKYGGSVLKKGERIFLKGSKEIYLPKEITELAREMESQFNTKTVLTIEFKDMTEEEQAKSGFPEAKMLPIPGH